MEFTSNKSIGYWVEYLAKFGVEHLILPEASFIEMYDLDIKIGLLAILIIIAIVLKKCIRRKH